MLIIESDIQIHFMYDISLGGQTSSIHCNRRQASVEKLYKCRAQWWCSRPLFFKRLREWQNHHAPISHDPRPGSRAHGNYKNSTLLYKKQKIPFTNQHSIELVFLSLQTSIPSLWDDMFSFVLQKGCSKILTTALLPLYCCSG